MRRLAVLVVLVVLAFATAAEAQLPGPGLQYQGTSGSGVGSFVFDCTPLDVTVVPGETVTLTVWGDVGAPYALFRSPAASLCQPIAGFEGALVLDAPRRVFDTGVLTEVSPCLACPDAFTTYTFAVPPTLPPGSVGIQAATFGGGQLAFTSAIRANVP